MKNSGRPQFLQSSPSLKPTQNIVWNLLTSLARRGVWVYCTETRDLNKSRVRVIGWKWISSQVKLPQGCLQNQMQNEKVWYISSKSITFSIKYYSEFIRCLYRSWSATSRKAKSGLYEITDYTSRITNYIESKHFIAKDMNICICMYLWVSYFMRSK